MGAVPKQYPNPQGFAISSAEALFYSLAGASLGLFTVSYFTSFMLLEDCASRETRGEHGQYRAIDKYFGIPASSFETCALHNLMKPMTET